MHDEATAADAASSPPGSPDKATISRFGVGSVVLVTFVALSLISRWMIKICRPNEMLVVTGSQSNQGSQGKKGYRVVANGGWTFVKPILETARRMDVTLLPVLVEVNNAYSNGGTPLNIQAIANVKVSTDPDVRNNAIERFLGRDPKEIVQVAKENLEGNLRSVLAQLTPEQVNEDRLRLPNGLPMTSAKTCRLGMQLDTLKPERFRRCRLSGPISRRRVAQIVGCGDRRSRGDRSGGAQGGGNGADRRGGPHGSRNRRPRKGQRGAHEGGGDGEEGVVEEERTQAAELEAQAKAEQQLQKVRAELERLVARAEQVLPAQASQKAKELKAGQRRPPLRTSKPAAWSTTC